VVYFVAFRVVDINPGEIAAFLDAVPSFRHIQKRLFDPFGQAHNPFPISQPAQVVPTKVEKQFLGFQTEKCPINDSIVAVASALDDEILKLENQILPAAALPVRVWQPPMHRLEQVSCVVDTGFVVVWVVANQVHNHHYDFEG
jgi:hypothetical protein